MCAIVEVCGAIVEVCVWCHSEDLSGGVGGGRGCLKSNYEMF